MAATSEPNLRLRLRRELDGTRGFIARAWGRWWVKALAILAGLALLGMALIWLLFARDLPSVDTLKSYEPPLPTMVRAIDGAPMHSFARERRVQLAYEEYPPILIRAFLAAEDRTFFEHSGVDYPGIVAALISNFSNDGRPIGASTITQQVAKNLLLNDDVTYVRKMKEAILAYRIEDALTKQEILELYLNQIFLGRNSYGVQAASRAYFDKDLGDLSLGQIAYLAILPKAPSNYTPERHGERAVTRRNFVLSEMLRNSFIDQAQYSAAIAEPLGAVGRRSAAFETVGGYFVEEVRRNLLERFGETDEDGPYSVYGGGLWVRTSYDQKLQDYAEEALRNGLVRYDRGKGWSGPIETIEFDDDRWEAALASANAGAGFKEWRPGLILSKSGGTARLGFPDGTTGTLPRWAATMAKRGGGGAAFDLLKRGDIIAVKQEGGNWVLRNIPSVSGGMVVQDPHTGRVMAMQGGFDSRIGSFNRATQALRQPGSTIKPFVYSAALDHGMTPATLIVDGAFCVYQSARLGRKCFSNFGGGGGAGPQTMRWGLEQSRNLMTVRAADQTGMDNVVKLIERVGIGKHQPYLANALGAGETTVLKLTNAYSMLANNGRELKPSLIDYVQDRRGKVIFPENWRACEGCNTPDWNGQAMPRPATSTRQLIDAMTAYQMVHILEGVVQRGTAQNLRDLDRPLFGKTGTSTGPTDVWFVGGSADLVAGLYIGYDQPTNMGGYAQGGTLAAPIFKEFAVKAFEGMAVVPFRAPAGVRLVRIDRRSGRRVYGAWPGDDPKSAVIWEAFKPESEPRRSIRREELVDRARAAPKAARARAENRPRDSEFLQREGGIY